MNLNDQIAPHAEAIKRDATAGNTAAKNIIALHRMWVACPSDPGAPALCEAAFKDWLKRAREYEERAEKQL